MAIPTATRVDANLGIDSEIGVDAEIQSGLKIRPQNNLEICRNLEGSIYTSPDKK